MQKWILHVFGFFSVYFKSSPIHSEKYVRRMLKQKKRRFIGRAKARHIFVPGVPSWNCTVFGPKRRRIRWCHGRAQFHGFFQIWQSYGGYPLFGTDQSLMFQTRQTFAQFNYSSDSDANSGHASPGHSPDFSDDCFQTQCHQCPISFRNLLPLTVLFGKPRRDKRNVEIDWKPPRTIQVASPSRHRLRRQDLAWVARETGLQWQSQHPLIGKIFWASGDWILPWCQDGYFWPLRASSAKWRPAR